MLSKPPIDSGNEWQRPNEHHLLRLLLQAHSPALDSDNRCIRINSGKIVIRNTDISVHPTDWGIERNWFFWSKKDLGVKELINEVKEGDKLDLETWDLKDLLQNGQIENIKDWLLSQWQSPSAHKVRGKFCF